MGRSLFTVALILATGAGGILHAQERSTAYPSRSIRMVVGNPPGGGNDNLARIIAPKLSASFGQPVVVENRPGANGIIAAELVAKAPPDGYTVLVAPSGVMVMNPATYDKLPHDPQKDFAPITIVGVVPLVLTVNSSMPVKTAKEFIAAAKSHPDQYAYGSGSSAFQMASELFKLRTGTEIRHIPYKGAAAMVSAILSGEVTMALVDVSPLLPLARRGRLRALAVPSNARIDSLPDVPTMAEAGIPDLEIGLWTGLFVPAATPAPVVRKLTELVAIVQSPEVKESISRLGIVPVGNTPEQVAAMVRTEIATWTAVAKKANIKAEQ